MMMRMKCGLLGMRVYVQHVCVPSEHTLHCGAGLTAAKMLALYMFAVQATQHESTQHCIRPQGNTPRVLK